MKKWLILFVLVDFAFVGLVFKISLTADRQIASYDDPFYSQLTAGQKTKYDLVKSMRLTADNEKIAVRTDRLQAICQTQSTIELKYEAINVAYAGEHPTISHIFSCENIRENMTTDTLITSVEDFEKMHSHSQLKLSDSEMKAVKVFADEEFPIDWSLSEIIVTGEMKFSVSKAEFNKVNADSLFTFSVAP